MNHIHPNTTTNSYQIRKALPTDFQAIWEIILFAKQTRKSEGSTQWQDGYPSEDTIHSDIENNYGYVLTENNIVCGYVAVIFSNEPAYERIEGEWLTQGNYTTVHRMAISVKAKGRGLGKFILKKVEEISLDNNYPSIRIDTNFDNIPMLKILEKMEYIYCGEVYFRGMPRKAFEKILISK